MRRRSVSGFVAAFLSAAVLAACSGGGGSPTPVHTVAPTVTPTPTPSASATATASAAPSASPTATASASAMASATATPTIAATATPTSTAAPTSTPTATATPTPTPKPTATPTAAPTATPTASPSSSPTGASTPAITGLHVSGNEILNGAGRQIVPHGVDRSGTEYACVQGYGIFDGPSDQTSIAAIASWHTNIVRVPLNEDCWLAINGVNAAYAGSNYQTAIVNYVNLLNANGLIAILDLHWNAPGTQSATGQEPMADADHSPAFWSSVASTFKGNSSVIFDLYNEPYSISWTCWRDGGTASACGTPFDIAGMNTLISAVRSTGAKNIVMAGGIGYSGDISQWLAYKPTDATGNLAASWHVYNFGGCTSTSCYDSNGGAVAAGVPIIAGEIGENDCAHGFIDTLMGYMDAHGIAYLGWAWNTDFNCNSGPGLITDYNGTPTNYGIGLQQHLATLAAAAHRRGRAP